MVDNQPFLSPAPKMNQELFQYCTVGSRIPDGTEQYITT